MKLLLLLFACAPSLSAQTGPLLDLSGEWRMSADDRPAYADPQFDDRTWKTVRLPWTQRPPIGTYWLRRGVDVPVGFSPATAFLTVGPVGEAYEVYINGERVAVAGKFGDFREAQLAHSRTFPLPPGPLPARLHVAVHVERMDVAQALSLFPGGTYAVTGSAPSLVDENLLLLLRQKTNQAPNLVLWASLLACALLFWLLWLAEKDRVELWWLGLLTISRGAIHICFYLAISLDSYPLPAPLSAYFAHALSSAALAELIMAFANVRTWWMHGLVWSYWLLHLLLRLPVRASALFDFAVLVLLFLGWQRNRQRDRLTWVTLLLVTMSHFNVGLRALPTSIEVNGYDLNLTSSALIVLSVLLAFLSLRRLLADRREKQRLAGELEAARTVQQLLLPAAAAQSGAWDLDAVYEPAQEVGGDFHWNRTTPDGSLVVVIGDVSGKGLKAAMLVSVAIGALRNEKSSSPAAILRALNEGLTGHTGGGFVTCCCARFDADGTTRVANAGHPAPYDDGEEVVVESGLPLGVVPDADYQESPMKGEQFVFISDGVIESANAKGELLGFDRTRQMSTRSAQEIADAARDWGQNDDITVVTVRRATLPGKVLA
ncbi:MAG: serine/threonine-protein phosphatase [Acidobacteria bacterium]|nr:serine/threonine-protein phosphatase [Acidobacteriota bacterium]